MSCHQQQTEISEDVKEKNKYVYDNNSHVSHIVWHSVFGKLFVVIRISQFYL